MLRQALLGLSRVEAIKSASVKLPITRPVVDRFIAGEHTEEALAVTGQLVASGLRVTIDHLGEDTTTIDQADATTVAYLDLLAALGSAGLAEHAEVSLKLSAVGQFLGREGETVALENARMISIAARTAGTTVTLDMEDHTTTDSTLAVLAELRKEFPDTGAVIQAYLHRSEADCRALATAGSRVRLCKGAYREPGSVAFTERQAIDKAYVRCAKILMAGDGYPMLATHDPRLIDIGAELARRFGRGKHDFEFQMLHGIRPTEQLRLANAGHRMRVYLPYGQDWYGYMVRRMAEKPANLGLFVKSLSSRK